NGLRLFLVGYESGNDDTLTRIKKGVTTDEMRRFTKDCHKAGVVIHGTFILGLPVETKETIEQTINFAKELDVFSLQVSLAAPYPGTELYEQAKLNGWFVKKDKTDLVEDDGLQQSTLAYPNCSKEEIFASVERFYHRYYLRPKPVLRIIRTMLEDKDVCVRRVREGYEFFKSMAERRSDLAAATANG
ncbi:MAG: hopanoid biosynthesis associated radical SAM protein HpnJ, partial [Verrucomicrobia bacterium]|nr:hopanoid biosynthesis associated radical SAM protein HpnJ [Verrucomicrobiota bacterium]NDF00021.1 hopanoid biosynthesis associated radical SAM protein HpnJ [Verrucomicrobiota bacterium]